MKKELSLVLVDPRHYRSIARDNWGLTQEQMKGKHVHHRIPASRGGTNDPSNLYVCSEWFHDNVWHEGEGGFTGLASKGAEAAHRDKGEDGKSVLAVRAGSLGGKASGRDSALKGHEVKDEDGKSLRAKKMAEAAHAEKDERGRSKLAVRAGECGLLEAIKVNSKPVVVYCLESSTPTLYPSRAEAARGIGAHPSNLRKAMSRGGVVRGHLAFPA
jgi:hypothetical protein